ncbi:MAG TPA: N-acetylmuramoyl-L-alanine amidase [Stellaceae bacterium]|jgi:N-acetylmuramoyl-L-alanine amidase|nr:N-acetylmuramoyl-L-alanine amidase [Stellaceae bacterium]
MRDIVIARRALLALAVGVAACGWSMDRAAAAARRKPVSSSKPSWSKPSRSKPPPHAIALDPGHGGIDPGAISPHGIYEKTITLAMARTLAGDLERTGRYRPILTRSRDTYVPLRARVARARAHRAELFLSLHADALPDRELRGLAVYTLSDQASDREAAALAVRENKDDFVAGVHLARQPREISAILIDLARRQTNNASLSLAQTIVDELGRTVPLLERPHRAAGFAVLTAPDVPSALVELGCLSNPEDEKLLPQHLYQQRLAAGLLRAIDDYFAARVTT